MTRFARLLVIASLSVGGLVTPAAVHGAPDGDGGYVVQPGDYLFGIAHQQGVTLGDLLGANDLTVTDVIHPGQRLAIPAAAARSSAGTGTYTVRSGDSLFGIAQRLGVSTRSLLAANRLTLTSVIHPGQRLAIPAAAARSSAGTGTYTVRSGDSLFGIAQRLGVSTRSLLAANRLTLTSVIHPGQRLAIPAAAARSSAGTGTYTVRSGDSLYGIARRLGVSTRSLLAANRLTLTSVIHPGQRLEVPAGANPSASTTPPPTAAPRPTAGPPPTPASAEVVERIIRDVWPDALEETALAIAWRESHYEPGAQSQCCSGLFQIYYDVHKVWLADLGINSRNDLYHPRTNAEAAFALYQRAGGWGPWSLAGD